MRRHVVPVLLIAFLGTPVPTFADPVTVTSGFYSVTSGEDGEWVFNGSGFSFSGSGLGDVLPFWDCLRCLPGAPVSMDARLTGQLGTSWAGPVSWQGSTYDRVFWAGDLLWDAGVALAGAGAVASSPFTFTGTVTAFADEARTSPLFSTALTGTGTATVRFFRELDGGTAEVFRVSYDFAADAAPVPEPASVILLASGLGALAIRRRRARTHPTK